MEVSRTNIINYFGGYYNYQTYLEVGVFLRWNFDKVQYPYKVGVDPNPRGSTDILQMTSDEFFERNTNTFDFIFLDGLHYHEQLYKDIQNSLKILNPNGTIMCHDLNPLTETSQGRDNSVCPWHGDCWKAWVRFRSETTQYRTYCVNTDCGCGIIRKSAFNITPIKIDEDLTFENLEKNRKEWLNLVTTNDYQLIL